ncbi:HEAT repeat domain-containing protein, partial [Thermodesulfobacteriota bacterium]
EYLFSLLDHEDSEIVKTVINILKESLDESSLNAILGVLDSASPDVRILVYKSLEGIESKALIDKAMSYIEKEKDETIRRMAKRVLGV